MKLDLHLGGLATATQSAPAAEAANAAGVWSAETGSDPFLPLAVAATVTDRVELGTAIAVAFARNPMTVATLAHDIQSLSGGRMILGLGSQVRAHIERRYSMEWSKPAARMREFVRALHAIWACWDDGEPLRFEGDFYRHTLMTPAFSPLPFPDGRPRVFLSAVGTLMTSVAGEVADGLLVHPFSTSRYLREVTLPALARGLERAEDPTRPFELTAPSFVVTGDTDEEYAAADRAARERIAFYASTPAYRGVLEVHGWGEVQEELNRLSKAGQWKEMGNLIDDDMLDAFAVCAPPDEVGARLSERYGDVCDRVLLGGLPVGPEQLQRTVDALG
ncbi:MAG: TIGR03617 family F420-dependent LLM class oxidoreductase, partial [Acidimicrobiia bacterium]